MVIYGLFYGYSTATSSNGLTPEVVGALRDALKFARTQVEIELNPPVGGRVSLGSGIEVRLSLPHRLVVTQRPVCHYRIAW